MSKAQQLQQNQSPVPQAPASVTGEPAARDFALEEAQALEAVSAVCVELREAQTPELQIAGLNKLRLLCLSSRRGRLPHTCPAARGAV